MALNKRGMSDNVDYAMTWQFIAPTRVAGCVPGTRINLIC